jgi:predicted Zn finger-like uncharacterized protein
MAFDQVNCPECRRKLRVPEELAGQQVQCPTCGHVFTAILEAPAPLPSGEDEPAPPTSLIIPRAEEDEDGNRPRRRRVRDEEDMEDDDDWRRGPRRDQLPHRGGVVLALGIIALAMLFPFGIILGPIAWILGNKDLGEIRAGRMDYQGEGLTNGGRICGMIATLLSVVCCGGYLLVILTFRIRGGGF